MAKKSESATTPAAPAAPAATIAPTVTLAGLPAVGAPLEGGTFAGLTTLPTGAHVAVVLLAHKPGHLLNWRSAMDWAQGLGAELPNRPVAAMLFANLQSEFDRTSHWTKETFSGSDASSSAWHQHFESGPQDLNDKNLEVWARAVRLLELTT